MFLRFLYPILIFFNIILLIKIFLTDTPVNYSYRLSKAIRPYEYHIKIQPFLELKDASRYLTFNGVVNITFETLQQEIKTIELHGTHLKLLEVILNDKFENKIEKIEKQFQDYEDVTEKLYFTLINSLQFRTNYTLFIKYTGEVRHDLKGFFRFSCEQKGCQAVTLFYPNNARLALPCFDEPEFKAKFIMNIVRPLVYKSFFNTKLLRTSKISGNYEMDTFEDTPLMSTYLLAFMVSTYISYGSTELKLIDAKEMISNSNFSYQTALNVLKSCEFYFKIPYKELGNPVLQITSATKYKYKAMESWGLIISRPGLLHHIENYTDGCSNKQSTISTIIHEMTHMWFGNSVTLNWWNNLWLNEAFARYYEFVLGQQFYPAYEFVQQFVIDKMHTILEIDALVDTQAISVRETDFKTPQDMNYITNRISYDKGASVLRMFCSAMGRDNFDLAVREYLKEYHLKNTVPEDILKHFRRNWPKNQQVKLKQLFQAWIEQMGYPLVTITTTAGNGYLLKQQHFLIENGRLKKSSLSYTIPITYTTENEMDFRNLTPKFYFNRTSKELAFGSNLMHHKWLIINIQQTGYYRVFYVGVLLNRLQEAFLARNYSGIPIIQRASIISDLFAYAEIGLITYKRVFNFTTYLSQETEYLPWKAALKGIDTIVKRLTPWQYENLAHMISELLERVYQTLGFESHNNTVLEIYNRNQIISWLCKFNHEDCNKQAQGKLMTYFMTGTKISPDFRETLYCSACRYGGIQIFDHLKQMFLKEKLKSEKLKILKAMGCTCYHIKIYYKFLLSDKVSKNFKLIGLKASYTQTPQNVDAIFQIIVKDVKKLAQTLQSWPTTTAVISDISQYFTTREQLFSYKKFIKQQGHLLKSSVDILYNSVKTIENSMEWSSKHLKNLFNEDNGTNRSKSLKCNLH